MSDAPHEWTGGTTFSQNLSELSTMISSCPLHLWGGLGWRLAAFRVAVRSLDTNREAWHAREGERERERERERDSAAHPLPRD